MQVSIQVNKSQFLQAFTYELFDYVAKHAINFSDESYVQDFADSANSVINACKACESDILTQGTVVEIRRKYLNCRNKDMNNAQYMVYSAAYMLLRQLEYYA